ncbi:hypothetical protein M1N24_00260 [Dehalococcoidia bacterium]|nr:hypothetical protein [Dehalococcoidia bacterium]
MKISFTGVVLLLTFVLSLFSGSLAYADHYSKEFIESQKQLIKAAFASGAITEENYHAKLESFTVEHYDNDPSRATGKSEINKKEMTGLTPIISVAIAVFAVFVLLNISANKRHIKRMRIQKAAINTFVSSVTNPPVPIDTNLDLNKKRGWTSKIFRDTNRDEMFASLQSLGLKAEMAERRESRREDNQPDPSSLPVLEHR